MVDDLSIVNNNSKIVMEEFILSGTLNVRNFISPIKKQGNVSKSSIKEGFGKAGILYSSSPMPRLRMSSTPAFQKTNCNFSFGIANKENDKNAENKNKFNFLKEINEVDEEESYISDSLLDSVQPVDEHKTEAVIGPAIESVDKNETENIHELIDKDVPRSNTGKQTNEKIFSVSVLNDSSLKINNQLNKSENNISSHGHDFKLTQKANDKFNLEKLLQKKIDKSDDEKKSPLKQMDLENNQRKHRLTRHKSLPHPKVLELNNKTKESTQLLDSIIKGESVDVADLDSKRPQTQGINLKKRSLPRRKSLPFKRNSDLEPRRSKRVKIDKNVVSKYEFETIKDFRGDDLIVKKLVKIDADDKRRSCPSKIEDSKTLEATKTSNKDHNEYIMLNEKKVRVFSFNQNLTKKTYKRVSDGVNIYQLNEEENDGILCIDVKSQCRTQRHTDDVFYVVRKGRCTFIINEIEKTLEHGEVVKIPKNIKYKIRNENRTKSYVHFQFL